MLWGFRKEMNWREEREIGAKVAKGTPFLDGMDKAIPVRC
jgi:hypothetical protein